MGDALNPAYFVGGRWCAAVGDTRRQHADTPSRQHTHVHARTHTHTLHVCLSRKVRTNWLALYAAVVVSSTTTTRVGATRFSNYRRRRDPRRSEGVYVLGVAARDGGWARGGGVCVFRVRVCDCVQKGVAVVYRGGSDTFLKFMTLSSIVLTSLAAVVYVWHAVLTCLRARSAAPSCRISKIWSWYTTLSPLTLRSFSCAHIACIEREQIFDGIVFTVL